MFAFQCNLSFCWRAFFPAPSLRGLLFYNVIFPNITSVSPVHDYRLLFCKAWPPSRRRVVPDDLPHLFLVQCAVLLVQVVRVRLGRRLWIDLIQQHLYPQENLLDRYGRLPTFFFVQDTETDGAGGIYVGMEQRRDEFACDKPSASTLDIV